MFNNNSIGTQGLMSRRRFLKSVACAGIALAFPNITLASRQPRHLSFNNLHTGEKLSLTYFENGQYVSDALKEINNLLRDHRSGDIFTMDPSLMDLLYDLQTQLDTNKTFQVISGYRSPATNARLHKNSSGVASKSLHMRGKAIDIRIEGIDSKVIKNTAIAMYRGGVGYYRKSDFVHIDTGRVRSW